VSRTEYASWGIAIVIVAVMGFIALHGPFNLVNKGIAASSTAKHYSELNVKIVTAPKTIGAYMPATITVHVGQSILFSNVSNAPHTVTGRTENSFNSNSIGVNSSWRFTAAKTGTFHYYCIYHPLMAGTLKVIS
jgi:plastocyanin